MNNKNWFNLFLLPAIVLFLSFNVRASGKITSKYNVEQMTKMIISILQDGSYLTYKDFISPEAYVINNNSYESFFALMKNNSDRESFIEGKDIKVGYVNVTIPDNKSAFMVLKTQSAEGSETHWHSVYFVLGKNNKWQIYSWHKS
jgi:hypothetical protein